MLKTSDPPTVAPPAAMYSHRFLRMRVGYLLPVRLACVSMARLPKVSRRSMTRSGRIRWLSLQMPEWVPRISFELNVYSTDPNGLKYLKAHREKYLKPGHTPASTWVVVSKLANPQWVVEMETVAAKA